MIEPLINIKWYEYEDILKFKNDDRFHEAFAFDNNHLDVLAVAAFDGDNMMGMAGASADGKYHFTAQWNHIFTPRMLLSMLDFFQYGQNFIQKKRSNIWT